VKELLAESNKAFFVECPTKRDVDVSDSDIQRYNLVVVGDSETNTLVDRIADRLPLATSVIGISLQSGISLRARRVVTSVDAEHECLREKVSPPKALYDNCAKLSGYL
jgi:hypothetical protein